jgi:threonine/homoserine/homoserine lactone efflux protein
MRLRYHPYVTNRRVAAPLREGQDAMDSVFLLPLFAAATINAAIPGPAFLIVIARGARGGLAGGAGAAFGCLLAVGLLLALVTALMLGVLQLGEPAFVALKLAGIAVLAYLGVRMLRATALGAGAERRHSAIGDVGAGLVVGVSSPFNLVFFLALIPQFIDPAALTSEHLAFACAAILLGSALPLAVVAILSACQAFLSPGGAVGVVRLGGAGFLAFAVFAAASLA